MAIKGIYAYIPNQIWIKEHPIRFSGFMFYTRMTIIRLKNNHMIMHSPVEITPAEQAYIKTIGEVKSIIAPSKLHHHFLNYFCPLFSDAKA